MKKRILCTLITSAGIVVSALSYRKNEYSVP